MLDRTEMSEFLRSSINQRRIINALEELSISQVPFSIRSQCTTPPPSSACLVICLSVGFASSPAFISFRFLLFVRLIVRLFRTLIFYYNNNNSSNNNNNNNDNENDNDNDDYDDFDYYVEDDDVNDN